MSIKKMQEENKTHEDTDDKQNYNNRANGTNYTTGGNRNKIYFYAYKRGKLHCKNRNCRGNKRMITKIEVTTKKCVICGNEFVPVIGNDRHPTSTCKYLCVNCNILTLKYILERGGYIMGKAFCG
jgi:hypothetical protein